MDEARIGNFTSGSIHRLMGNAKVKGELSSPALNYIKEKRRERRLKVEIGLDTTDRALVWGKTLEGFVFQEELDTSYALLSDQTLMHPSKEFCGTPDVVTTKEDDVVGDIKCPFTRNSFCELVEIIEHCGVEEKGVWVCKDSSKLEYFKEEKPEYFWQLVSNSILAKRKKAELIVFMPYITQLDKIKTYISNIDDYSAQLDAQWIFNCQDPARLPHIPVDSGYKNSYKFRFDVPEIDKMFLLAKVNAAYQKLIA